MMNDTYYEQIVSRNKPETKYVIYTIIDILACIIFLMIGFLKPLYWIGVPVTFILFYLYLRIRLQIEYEYIIVNDELTIDAVYHKELRKHLATFSAKEIQQIQRTSITNAKDYSNGEDRYYLTLNQGQTYVLSLDQKLLDSIKRYNHKCINL